MMTIAKRRSNFRLVGVGEFLVHALEESDSITRGRGKSMLIAYRSGLSVK